MTLSNLNEFKSKFQTYGFSMANLYDVQIDVGGSSKLFDVLQGKFRLADGSAGLGQMMELMKLYTSEATLPGVNMSTSEYRITNTPQLKYAYGAVFNEFSVTFTMDANSNIRKLFDKWTNIIYPYSQFRGVGDGVLRTRYKDDYIADITVTKFERGASSPRNRSKSNRIGGRRIIPDGETKRDSLFVDNVAVHAVRMKNAFPKSIDSMTLSGDAGQLTQFSVAFEYESLQTSTPTRSAFG